MELRHLRYFVAVAHTLHFGRAALALQIAQPSLSHQIRRLEAELKTTLLRRTQRRVELTHAGRLFLDEAREIVARADRAAMIARRAGGGEGGSLRVAVGYCMNQAAVTVAVSTFNDRHEKTRVELETMAVPSQLVALRDERLDVGFLRPPVTDPSLAHEVLVREPLLLALPRTHRLARRSTLRLSAVAGEPFILVPRDRVPVYHDAVLRACRDAGFVPDAPHETDHLQLILGLVAAGGGVALVPAFARAMKLPGVAFANVQPAAPDVETAIAWRRENAPPMMPEFAKVAREAFASHAPPR
jgi:DNA-binding transcriptional LysR family regulator